MSGFILINDTDGNEQLLSVNSIISIGKDEDGDIMVELAGDQCVEIEQPEFDRLVKLLSRL